MSETPAQQKKKVSKRGIIVLSSFSVVVVGIIGSVAFIGDDGQKSCSFVSGSSSSATSNQSSVILAPTSNFVDMQSIVSRASTEIRNSLGKNLPPEERKNALDRELSIIVADASPKLVVNAFIDPANGTEAQEIDTQIDATFQFLDKSAGCAGGSKATDQDEIALEPESDLLKALDVAADQLTHSGEKNLYVLGNGIQTVGAIEMQDNDTFPKTAARAIAMAKSLQISGQLPDLSGVTVNWYGLGQVDGSYQKPIPTSWTKGLRAFWAKIIELSGGSVGYVCEQCGSGKPSSKAIQVQKIDVDNCPLIIKLYEDDGVEFVPDSSNFTSDSKATAAANATVARFEEKKCSTLTVTGFAASGRSRADYLKNRSKIDKTNQTLTELRAKAFARLLRSAGFKGQIIFSGGGTCGTEWNSSGDVDLDKQKLCRRVEVSN